MRKNMPPWQMAVIVFAPSDNWQFREENVSRPWRRVMPNAIDTKNIEIQPKLMRSGKFSYFQSLKY